MNEEKYPVKITMTVDISEFFDLTEGEVTDIVQEHKFPEKVREKMLGTLTRMAQNNSFSDDNVYVHVRDEEDNTYLYQEYGRL